jgi:hypothetical protein
MTVVVKSATAGGSPCAFYQEPRKRASRSPPLDGTPPGVVGGGCGGGLWALWGTGTPPALFSSGVRVSPSVNQPRPERGHAPESAAAARRSQSTMGHCRCATARSEERGIDQPLPTQLERQTARRRAGPQKKRNHARTGAPSCHPSRQWRKKYTSPHPHISAWGPPIQFLQPRPKTPPKKPWRARRSEETSARRIELQAALLGFTGWHSCPIVRG